MSGKLIVLEGGDGSGTTTQAHKLVSHLKGKGFKVCSSAEPTDSGIGKEIRKMLSQSIAKEHDLLVSLALCFAADRMYHIHNFIVPNLKTHDFVILDRYLLSSLVYQGMDLPINFVKTINSYAISPHLTIVIDLDPKTALSRLSLRGKKKDFYESIELMTKVRNGYLQLAKENYHDTVIVDGSRDLNSVHEEIVSVIKY